MIFLKYKFTAPTQNQFQRLYIEFPLFDIVEFRALENVFRVLEDFLVFAKILYSTFARLLLVQVKSAVEEVVFSRVKHFALSRKTRKFLLAKVSAFKEAIILQPKQR